MVTHRNVPEVHPNNNSRDYNKLSQNGKMNAYMVGP